MIIRGGDCLTSSYASRRNNIIDSMKKLKQNKIEKKKTEPSKIKRQVTLKDKIVEQFMNEKAKSKHMKSLSKSHATPSSIFCPAEDKRGSTVRNKAIERKNKNSFDITKINSSVIKTANSSAPKQRSSNVSRNKVTLDKEEEGSCIE